MQDPLSRQNEGLWKFMEGIKDPITYRPDIHQGNPYPEHRVKRNAQGGRGVIPEFIGIVNYSVMALIQLELGENGEQNLSEEEARDLYNKHLYSARDLMLNKNHDYGEAWREMRMSSFTDIILMKLLRVKQIEDNMGKTFISEGIDANYQDIINYSIFALIKLEE